MENHLQSTAHRLPLSLLQLAAARSRYAASLAENTPSNDGLLDSLAASRPVWAAPPCCLAVSGGTDSALLALALRGGASVSAVTLAVAPASRDLIAARRLGEALGFVPASIIVGESDLLALIDQHKELLAGLADYTQRILALCELFLCRHAAVRGKALVTGHGPEAVLGGFHRRARRPIEDVDGILDQLFLNLERLNLVAAASGCELRLPFLEPTAFEAIVALRRADGTKEDVIRAASPDLPLPGKKSSLQNGSGVHYLFEKMARRNNYRYVRDYMKSLLQ